MPYVDYRPPLLPDTPATRHQAAVDAETEDAKREARQRYSQRVFEVVAAFRKLVNRKQEGTDDGVQGG